VSKIQPTQIEMANKPHAAPCKYCARDNGAGVALTAEVTVEDMNVNFSKKYL
jgi:hypothetical protein